MVTCGDYMDAVGTYGLTKSPGSSFGFVSEYESEPAGSEAEAAKAATGGAIYK